MLTLSIISPNKTITEKCVEIVLITPIGEITILPNHTNIFTITTGDKILFKDNHVNHKEHMIQKDSLVKIHNNTCQIVTQHIYE